MEESGTEHNSRKQLEAMAEATGVARNSFLCQDPRGETWMTSVPCRWWEAQKLESHCQNTRMRTLTLGAGTLLPSRDDGVDGHGGHSFGPRTMLAREPEHDVALMQ